MIEIINSIRGSANGTEFEDRIFPDRKVIDFLKSIFSEVGRGQANYSSSRAQRVNLKLLDILFGAKLNFPGHENDFMIAPAVWIPCPRPEKNHAENFYAAYVSHNVI